MTKEVNPITIRRGIFRCESFSFFSFCLANNPLRFEPNTKYYNNTNPFGTSQHAITPLNGSHLTSR